LKTHGEAVCIVLPIQGLMFLLMPIFYGNIQVLASIHLKVGAFAAADNIKSARECAIGGVVAEIENESLKNRN
jgi:hypothetical protein